MDIFPADLTTAHASVKVAVEERFAPARKRSILPWLQTFKLDIIKARKGEFMACISSVRDPMHRAATVKEVAERIRVHIIAEKIMVEYRHLTLQDIKSVLNGTPNARLSEKDRSEVRLAGVILAFPFALTSLDKKYNKYHLATLAVFTGMGKLVKEALITSGLLHQHWRE